MFVQVFAGKVVDDTAFRAAFDSWLTGAGRDADGWLGATVGTTDDGQLVALVRFESEDAARAANDRPGQGRWWEALAAEVDGEGAFFESGDVEEDIVGDLDTAGFVQVMRGRVSDPVRARELSRDEPGAWATFRPDILGSVLLTREDGEYVMAIYFTSEAEAREGEQKELPAELAAQMEEMSALDVGEVTYFDLRDPWLLSRA